MSIFEQLYLEIDHNQIIAKVKETIKDFPQNSAYHVYDLLTHTEKVVEYLKNHGADNDLILAGWLHDVGKVATKKRNEKTGYDQYLGHDKASVEWINANFPGISQKVKDMVLQHDRVSNISKEGKMLELMKMHDEKWLQDLLLLREADASAHNESGVKTQLEVLKQQKEKFERLKSKL